MGGDLHCFFYFRQHLGKALRFHADLQALSRILRRLSSVSKLEVEVFGSELRVNNSSASINGLLNPLRHAQLMAHP